MTLGETINTEFEDTVKYIHLDTLLGTLQLHRWLGNRGHYSHVIGELTLGKALFREQLMSLSTKDY